MPKGLADPGELSALTRRSGNPSCKASVSRTHDAMETARSPLHTARRNYVAADEKYRLPQRGKKVEAKVGFEPTWTALQTVASPHSATSPLPNEFSSRAVKRHLTQRALPGGGLIAMR